MEPLLTVNGLTVCFGGFCAAENVCFTVNRGETVCLVGESGCGKSASVLSLPGLLPRTGHAEGEALFGGHNLLALTPKQLDAVRGGEIGVIFQDALSALNPVLSIGTQLTESILAHTKLSRAQARQRAAELLAKVGLPDAEAMLKKFPHTLSGGQRQRVMIAMAVSCGPKLLIADEPTTALDVTVQAQILQLLRDLQRENGMGILLITHDLGVVAEMADRVVVMYAGRVAEQAPVKALFAAPLHPYTKALLQSIPSMGALPQRALHPIGGTVPEHYDAIAGCRFASRCPCAREECAQPQPLRETTDGRQVSCCRAEEVTPDARK